MEKLWKSCGNAAYATCRLEKPWRSRGEAVEMPWNSCGNAAYATCRLDKLRKLRNASVLVAQLTQLVGWKSCREAVEKLWESCGKAVGKLWKSCGKGMFLRTIQ